MNIPVPELQSMSYPIGFKYLTNVLTDQLADRLDAFFRDRAPCDGSEESIKRLNEEVPRGPKYS